MCTYSCVSLAWVCPGVVGGGRWEEEQKVQPACSLFLELPMAGGRRWEQQLQHQETFWSTTQSGAQPASRACGEKGLPGLGNTTSKAQRRGNSSGMWSRCKGASERRWESRVGPDGRRLDKPEAWGGEALSPSRRWARTQVQFSGPSGLTIPTAAGTREVKAGSLTI